MIIAWSRGAKHGVTGSRSARHGVTGLFLNLYYFIGFKSVCKILVVIHVA